MANPHGRCEVCKERHVPGNCKGVELPFISDLSEAIGGLLRYVEESKETWALNFKPGTVGGEHLKRIRRTLRSTGLRPS